MYKYSVGYIIAFIIFLSACAPLPYYYFENRTYARGQDKGLLLCSVKMNESDNGSINPSYYIRKIGDTEKFRIHMRGIPVPEEKAGDEKLCKVVVFELPAGEYELFHWNLFFNYGLIQFDKEPKDEFSITFTIKPDSINYIGELTIDIKPETSSKTQSDVGPYGNAVDPKNSQINKYIMEIVDRSARDLEIAADKEPSISTLPIFKCNMPCKNGCLRETKTTNGFVYLPIVVVN